MIFFEPSSRDRSILPHDPLKALVAPRPIGWISTMGADGAINLAPYSFFNLFSSSPAILGFSSESPKDSQTFAGETGEFVWNLATWNLREAMNATSAGFARGVNEFEQAGLAMAPSRLVRPPRVAASPAAVECRVVDQIALKDVEGRAIGAVLTLGQVIGVHIDPAFIREGKVDTAALEIISRCGYLGDYAVTRTLFEMRRPG